MAIVCKFCHSKLGELILLWTQLLCAVGLYIFKRTNGAMQLRAASTYLLRCLHMTVIYLTTF